MVVRYCWLLCASLALGAASARAADVPASSVTLQAAGGVTVHGDYYAAPRPKALILLFHQAGSGKGEYRNIAPRLVRDGFSALAIDQRSGGSLFGRNETAAAFGKGTSYLDAAKDLDAAIAWARSRKLPIILWGSSYSAALVFLEAARQPDIKAVLAFSPGEYLGNATLVHQAAARLRIPLYLTSASDPEEVAAARSIVAASPSRGKVQFVPRHGVHGSSTLLVDRDPQGAAENWSAVEAFLRRSLPAAS
ncbi:Serine aminopeptidase, S33 [compost metagenome]|jgi:dienelactone hydrolase